MNAARPSSGTDRFRPIIRVALLGGVLLLSACASKPMDGREPGDLRSWAATGGAVKTGSPYQVLGKTYYPEDDLTYDKVGVASWYGPGFHGKATANGETYDQNAMTAAHPTLPMPSVVEVTHLRNGRSILVNVNDRGPFADGRIIDLSKRAADELGMLDEGVAKVRVRLIKPESLALRDLYRRRG